MKHFLVTTQNNRYEIDADTFHIIQDTVTFNTEEPETVYDFDGEASQYMRQTPVAAFTGVFSVQLMTVSEDSNAPEA